MKARTAHCGYESHLICCEFSKQNVLVYVSQGFDIVILGLEGTGRVAKKPMLRGWTEECFVPGTGHLKAKKKKKKRKVV